MVIGIETILILNIISSFSLFVIYTFLSNFNRSVFNKKKDYVIGYGVFILITTIVNMYIPIIAIPTIIIGVIVLGHGLYNKEKIYIVYYFLFSVLLIASQIVFSEAFSLFMHYLNVNFYTIDLYMIANSIVIQIANLACCRMFIAIFKDKKFIGLTRYQYFNFLLLPLFSILYVITLTMYVQNYNSVEDKILLVVNVISIFLFNMFITNIFSSISKNNELKNKIELYEKKSKMEYEYYTALEGKYNDSRKIMHDIKNHIQTIDSLYNSGDKEEAKTYVKHMYGFLDSLGQKIYTENKVLNIIINDKVTVAKRYNIDMKIYIGDVDISFIEEMDITTIVSNLLDNAIDAVKEAKTKEIIFKMDKFNGILVLNITNNFKKIRLVNGDFKTTKENHMGLGLSNVKRVVEKYSGSLNIKTTEETFKVSIMIPN